LLVVIAILGVLIALLLPAVQRAREAARRSECANHLRQVGLALLSYHDALGSFPSGYLSGYDQNGNDTGPGWGWAALTLPYLEQGNLGAQLETKLPIEAATNQKVRIQSVSVYLCPSDEVEQVWTAVRRDLSGKVLGTICEVAAAHYVGVFGTTEPGVDGDGAFFRNSQVALRDITDGTSQTMLVGERSHPLGDATWVGAVTGAALFPSPDSPAPPVVENSSGMVLGHTGDMNGPSADNSYVNQFSSTHDRGAQFLFADGHVTFLTTPIAYNVYLALSTRSRGEPLSGEL